MSQSHRRIRRNTSISQKFKSAPSRASGTLQLTRNELEELQDDSKSPNLSPEVVSQLQSTHGNQFVNQLTQQSNVQRNINIDAYSQQFKMGGISEISSTQSRTTDSVQRAPKSPEQRQIDAFNSKQVGKPLEYAFGDEIKSKGCVADIRWIFDPNFRLWKEQQLNSLRWYQFSKKQRISSYNNVFDLLNGRTREHHDDMASLKAFADKKHQTESLSFLVAVSMFRRDPSRTRFFKMVEDYIVPGNLNIGYFERAGLIERADRMRRNEIDENAQPITDNMVDDFDTAFEN